MGDLNEKASKKTALSSLPICNTCKNHINGLKCKAFDEIPDSILFGDNDHSKPLSGQKNNIIFEEKKV